MLNVLFNSLFFLFSHSIVGSWLFSTFKMHDGYVGYHYGFSFYYNGVAGKLIPILRRKKYGGDPYHGEEEEIQGKDDVDNDDGNKSKESSMPLWSM